MWALWYGTNRSKLFYRLLHLSVVGNNNTCGLGLPEDWNWSLVFVGCCHRLLQHSEKKTTSLILWTGKIVKEEFSRIVIVLCIHFKRPSLVWMNTANSIFPGKILYYANSMILPRPLMLIMEILLLYTTDNILQNGQGRNQWVVAQPFWFS